MWEGGSEENIRSKRAGNNYRGGSIEGFGGIHGGL